MRLALWAQQRTEKLPDFVRAIDRWAAAGSLENAREAMADNESRRMAPEAWSEATSDAAEEVVHRLA
jgi:hypothetical protein